MQANCGHKKISDVLNANLKMNATFKFTADHDPSYYTTVAQSMTLSMESERERVCVCVCVCERDRQTDRQTETEREVLSD